MSKIMQSMVTWFRTDFKQPFRSTNDDKNEKHPVVIYTVHQHVQEAHEIRDEWKGKPGHQVRCYERQIRVDTIITSAFVTVVRRIALVLALLAFASPASAQTHAYLTAEVISKDGQRKTCIYKANGNVYTRLVGRLRPCPLSIRLRDPLPRPRR